MPYAHPKRLTAKAITLAKFDLSVFSLEALRIGGFQADDVTLTVNKGGGFINFLNALGTIAQHKAATAYLNSHGIYASFSYKFPTDPAFTRTVLLYPKTTPDNEANRLSEDVKRLMAERGLTTE